MQRPPLRRRASESPSPAPAGFGRSDSPAGLPSRSSVRCRRVVGWRLFHCELTVHPPPLPPLSFSLSVPMGVQSSAPGALSAGAVDANHGNQPAGLHDVRAGAGAPEAVWGWPAEVDPRRHRHGRRSVGRRRHAHRVHHDGRRPQRAAAPDGEAVRARLLHVPVDSAGRRGAAVVRRAATRRQSSGRRHRFPTGRDGRRRPTARQVPGPPLESCV